MNFHLKEMMNPFPKTEIIVSNCRGELVKDSFLHRSHLSDEDGRFI